MRESRFRPLAGERNCGAVDPGGRQFPDVLLSPSGMPHGDRRQRAVHGSMVSGDFCFICLLSTFACYNLVVVGVVDVVLLLSLSRSSCFIPAGTPMSTRGDPRSRLR